MQDVAKNRTGKFSESKAKRGNVENGGAGAGAGAGAGTGQGNLYVCVLYTVYTHVAAKPEAPTCPTSDLFLCICWWKAEQKKKWKRENKIKIVNEKWRRGKRAQSEMPQKQHQQ